MHDVRHRTDPPGYSSIAVFHLFAWEPSSWFAGGMFEQSQTFGITTATVESYWIGTGITWRFGRGAGPEDECK